MEWRITTHTLVKILVDPPSQLFLEDNTIGFMFSHSLQGIMHIGTQ
jgi:hypothetical protein